MSSISPILSLVLDYLDKQTPLISCSKSIRNYAGKYGLSLKYYDQYIKDDVHNMRQFEKFCSIVFKNKLRQLNIASHVPELICLIMKTLADLNAELSRGELQKITISDRNYNIRYVQYCNGLPRVKSIDCRLMQGVRNIRLDIKNLLIDRDDFSHFKEVRILYLSTANSFMDDDLI